MNPEITMKQLHGELMDAAQAKGAVIGDTEEFVRDFLSKVGGGMTPETVVLMAEINQARTDLAKLQEKIAQDVYKWVDLHAQGDLFVDMPFRCPKSIRIGEDTVSCYTATMPQIHEYLGYITELRGKSAKAAHDVASLKEQWHQLAALEYERCGDVIARCVENGIDPNTVRPERPKA